jgi:hypothetical protein
MDVAQGILDDLNYLAAIPENRLLNTPSRSYVTPSYWTSFLRTIWRDNSRLAAFAFCDSAIKQALNFLEQAVATGGTSLSGGTSSTSSGKDSLGIIRLIFDALERVIGVGLPNLKATYLACIGASEVDPKFQTVLEMSRVRMTTLQRHMPPPSVAGGTGLATMRSNGAVGKAPITATPSLEIDRFTLSEND